MSDEKPKKRKMAFSKKIILSVLGFYLLFVIVCIVYQFVARESMSEVLIGSVSAACTGEAGFLSYLKGKERKSKGVEEECLNG